MSKTQNKDLTNLGDIYSDVFNKVVVTEQKIPVGEIGSADLEKQGGPEEKGGFKESENDITKIGKKNNSYNIRGYSYGDDNDPGLGCDGPLPTGKGNAYSGIVGEEDEEDNESGKKPDDDGDGVPNWADKNPGKDDHANKKNKKKGKETEKIAKESLNNFMATKSVFDKLYDKVMVNENFPFADEAAEDDLDALGLADAETDAEAGEDEITVTLDKDMAKALCDVLQAAIGDEDGDEDEFDMEGEVGAPEDYEGEEDEEGTPTAMNTHYNDGKNNKVGNLKARGAAAAKGASGKVDPGSAMNTHYNDGKNNKVGNLKAGQSAFE
tara:strand:+ start:3332 stop:4303 length:972 start_codon:yes stop_codon:yes gene_type:complete